MKNMRFFEENNDFLLVGALWNYKGGAWELLGDLGNYKNDSKMLRNRVFLVENWTKQWNRIIMKKMPALSIARGIWMQDQDALDCQILKRWCQFGELILLMQKQFSTLAPTLQLFALPDPQKTRISMNLE